MHMKEERNRAGEVDRSAEQNDMRGSQEHAGKSHPVSGNSPRHISEIDQQEGRMNNGRLGGNFDESPSTEEGIGQP
jgi:hypothetical protein